MMMNNGTNRPDITQYETHKLLEDRRTFTMAASLCRTAMLFNILIARKLEQPDDLSEAQELIDVLRENLQAIKLIDQELTIRHQANILTQAEVTQWSNWGNNLKKHQWGIDKSQSGV